MNRKLVIGFVMVMLAALALPGCMNRGNDVRVENTAAPNFVPQSNVVAAAPETTAMPQAIAFDWTAKAPQVEERIGRISEISEARVVTTGNTALVGVKFDPAYRGEMTERIREMVAAEVMAADPKISTVAVTADRDEVEEVYELSERTTLGREMDSLKDDIQEIVRNATTLR